MAATGKRAWRLKLALISTLVGATLAAQNIPDAPTPKAQSGQFPQDAPPAPKNEHPDQPAQPTPTPTPTPPPQRVGGLSTDRKELPFMVSRVNFVQLPVLVTDS